MIIWCHVARSRGDCAGSNLFAGNTAMFRTCVLLKKKYIISRFFSIPLKTSYSRSTYIICLGKPQKICFSGQSTKRGEGGRGCPCTRDKRIFFQFFFFLVDCLLKNLFCGFPYSAWVFCVHSYDVFLSLMISTLHQQPTLLKTPRE